MGQANQIGEDLQFVRQAVARREESRRMPGLVAWSVAIYVAVGYALLDVNTRWASFFFAIAGCLMGILGVFLGRRSAVRSGEYDRAEVRRIAMHWGSILLAIVGVVALGMSRGLQGQVVGQFIALSIGIIYFLGGVHFDRNFLWLGPLLMAGAIAITYVPHYGWTILGLLVALGLVVPTGFRSRLSHE